MSRKEELTREVQEQILAAVAHPEKIERISKLIADELALGEAFREVCQDLHEKYRELSAKCGELTAAARLWHNAFGSGE